MSETPDQTGLPPPDLEDKAFIIRGGLMELGPLRNSLQTAYVETGIYELSFFGANQMSVEAIAAAAQEPHPRLPQSRIRVSTVGILREQGYDPIPKGVFPHVALIFHVSPTDNELEELARLFESAIANPAL